MKKKFFLLSSLVMLALLFSSCSSSTIDSQMTVLNDSTETIDSIIVTPYLNVNSKAPAITHESLAENQEVGPGESVEYYLPNIVRNSLIEIKIHSDSGYSYIYIDYEKDAIFTVNFKGYDEDVTFTGTGASSYLINNT